MESIVRPRLKVDQRAKQRRTNLHLCSRKLCLRKTGTQLHPLFLGPSAHPGPQPQLEKGRVALQNRRLFHPDDAALSVSTADTPSTVCKVRRSARGLTNC